MIKKIIIIICSILLLASILNADRIAMVSPANPATPSMKAPSSATCTVTYAPSLIGDVNYAVGFDEYNHYSGFEYRPASNECICQVDVYVAQVDGTLTSSHDYYLWISSLDASNDLDGVTSATSAKVDGDTDISASSWVSFTFSPCLNVTAESRYGFAFFLDSDGNPDDEPEYDGTNFWRLSVDDERNLDNVQYGTARWRWDAEIPYNREASDAEDDVEVKVYTQ